MRKNQLAAKALLKEASWLKNNPYSMAPPRVVAAANELMGALTIVGRKPAADAIVRILGAVKDWSVAYEFLQQQQQQQQQQLQQQQHQQQQQQQKQHELLVDAVKRAEDDMERAAAEDAEHEATMKHAEDDMERAAAEDAEHEATMKHAEAQDIPQEFEAEKWHSEPPAKRARVSEVGTRNVDAAQ